MNGPGEIKCEIQIAPIDEDTLPECLKGRLALLDDYKLRVKCDAKEVVIDDLHHHGSTVMNRPDGNWLICFTWTRNWGPDARSRTVFINLATGEVCTGPSLLLFRARISFSPNWELIHIDAGIEASSARVIYVIDARDLCNLNVIFREEVWFDPPIEYECSFDSDSGFVTRYSFDFFEYGGKIICGEENIEQIKDMLVAEEKYVSVRDIDDREMWKSGVLLLTKTATVTRRLDPSKISPASAEKWGEKRYIDPNFEGRRAALMEQGRTFVEAHNTVASEPLSVDALAHHKLYQTKYGTRCTVNEMSAVEKVDAGLFVTHIPEPE